MFIVRGDFEGEVLCEKGFCTREEAKRFVLLSLLDYAEEEAEDFGLDDESLDNPLSLYIKSGDSDGKSFIKTMHGTARFNISEI